MAGFTAEEKRTFRFKKYAKDHIGDFFVYLLIHLALTEAVVFLCGGTRYGRGAWLALGYTVGRWLYELRRFRKDWLELDIKENK